MTLDLVPICIWTVPITGIVVYASLSSYFIVLNNELTALAGLDNYASLFRLHNFDGYRHFEKSVPDSIDQFIRQMLARSHQLASRGGAVIRLQIIQITHCEAMPSCL
jgi:hypothetical protein